MPFKCKVQGCGCEDFTFIYEFKVSGGFEKVDNKPAGMPSAGLPELKWIRCNRCQADIWAQFNTDPWFPIELMGYNPDGVELYEKLYLLSERKESKRPLSKALDLAKADPELLRQAFAILAAESG